MDVITRQVYVVTMCLALVCVLRTCDVPNRAYTAQLPMSAASASPHATQQPSPTVMPSAQPTTTPAPTMLSVPTTLPLATPALPRSAPQIADTLLLDQPWVFGGKALLAVDTHGRLTQLRGEVYTSLKRFHKPPLLIMHVVSGSFTVVDPVTWTRFVVPVASNGMVRDFLLSPDENEIVFSAPVDTATLYEDRFYSVDLHTHRVRLVFLHHSGNSGGKNVPYFYWGQPALFAWRSNNLYVVCQYSVSLLFWRIDVARPRAEPTLVYTLGEPGYIAMQPHGNLLLSQNSNQPYALTHLRTGVVRSLPLGWDEPAFSPDGQLLAGLVHGRVNPAFAIYDLEHNITTTLGYAPEPYAATTWSDDGQRMFTLGGTQGMGLRMRRVRLLERDGAKLGETQFPDDVDSFQLTSNDQMLVTRRSGDTVTLHSLPLRPGDTPYWPAVWLPTNDESNRYRVVYVPPK